MNRRPDLHTGWCARDHRCNHAEHRSDAIMVDLPGHGRAVLTRVRTADGREHAELRLRVALAPAEPAARRQLRTILTSARDLVNRATTTDRPRPGRRAA
ncbi:hypothetical protein ACFP2T_04865 [Plantactinospora solaniradicis]|uniref:Uncharacterized protein n=1 Tax=Plantactinospora solaniradicis TaxID=1723736 RepID=A0ABW1K1A0_9ACTN